MRILPFWSALLTSFLVATSAFATDPDPSPTQDSSDSAKPAQTTDAQPDTAKPAQTTDAQPDAAKPAQTTDAQPDTAKPAQTTDAQPDTAKPAQITDSQPDTAKPAQTTDAQPDTAKPAQTTDAHPDTPNTNTQTAQDSQTLALTDEQLTLNNQAVEAVNYRQFEKAEQLFKAMLQIQEVNIIWMNLGRTYANQNKCPEAADAYAKVATSPKSSDFPSDLIDATTADFLSDLKIKCSASISLACRQEESTVIVLDSGEERACSSEPLLIIPGNHTLYARTNSEAKVFHFDAEAGQRIDLDVTLTPEEINSQPTETDKIAPLPELDPMLVERSKLFKTVGYSLIGAGAALAVGGFTFMGIAYGDFQNHCSKGNLDDTCKEIDGKWESPMGFHEDKIKTYTTISGVIGGIGAAALITGLAFVVIDAVKYQPQIDAFANNHKYIELSPVFSPIFAGISFSGRF